MSLGLNVLQNKKKYYLLNSLIKLTFQLSWVWNMNLKLDSLENEKHFMLLYPLKGEIIPILWTYSQPNLSLGIFFIISLYNIFH